MRRCLKLSTGAVWPALLIPLLTTSGQNQIKGSPLCCSFPNVNRIINKPSQKAPAANRPRGFPFIPLHAGRAEGADFLTEKQPVQWFKACLDFYSVLLPRRLIAFFRRLRAFRQRDKRGVRTALRLQIIFLDNCTKRLLQSQCAHWLQNAIL